MQRTKSPGACDAQPGSGEATTGCANASATAPLAQPRKWARVLRAFLDGRTFNRFDAYRELRDSCLNTTVSQIEARGVRILRHEETVAGAFGPVHCMRYAISPDALQRARELLGLTVPAGARGDAYNALEQAA